ncbi:MAG: glycosyltransferase, partial [Candidatus Micrarchaeota archaeon]
REEKEAKFIIQGDGPARAACQKLARKSKYSKDIIFTGFIKEFEVPFFYSAADVFATASTFETQGLAMLESMACGRIAVGANSLAIPEMLHEGENGFLFKPYNEQECAEKLLKALELKDGKLKAMEKNARKVASQYSIQKSVDKLIAAYGKVL